MPAILVVEDDPDQLSIRCQILEHAGYSVQTAHSAVEALPLLSRCRLVLMDLRLPKTEDGLELIHAATQAGVRVVVLSGAEPESALPVDAFLTKPCSSRKLLETLLALCPLGNA